MPIGASPTMVYTLTGACHGLDAENVAAPLTLTVLFGANNECSDPKSRRGARAPNKVDLIA